MRHINNSSRRTDSSKHPTLCACVISVSTCLGPLKRIVVVGTTEQALKAPPFGAGHRILPHYGRNSTWHPQGVDFAVAYISARGTIARHQKLISPPTEPAQTNQLISFSSLVLNTTLLISGVLRSCLSQGAVSSSQLILLALIPNAGVRTKRQQWASDPKEPSFSHKNPRCTVLNISVNGTSPTQKL